MLFLVDIHQSDSFAYAAFKCSADCFRDTNITLKTNCICLEYSRNSSPCLLNVITPEDFVCPRSVALVANNTVGCISIIQGNVAKLNLSGLNSDDELNEDEGAISLEFMFLFNIEKEDVIEQCILRKFDSPMYLKDVMHDKYKEIDSCKVICTNCGSLLTENFMKFQSVHKYYDLKSELDEASFCHKHDDHGATEIKANSLYIDDMYFYFHHSILAYFKLVEENKTYKCFNCSSTLSFQKKMDNLQYIGFFSDKVMLIKSQDDENNYEKHKEEASLLSFYSIIQDIIKTDEAPKLYLQSKVDETTEVLLLWIDGEKIVQFILEEPDENKIQRDIELKGKEVFSVLYCLTSPGSDLSKKWKHNFSVEFFHISDNTMNVVKGLFRDSPDYFSLWEETNPGFTHGYLPAEVPIS